MQEHTPEIDVMPIWFADRMTSDEWFFAFLLNNGSCIPFSSIHEIKMAANGEIWVSVNWLDDKNLIPKDHQFYNKMILAPTTRRLASFNARNIVAAFEIADT